MSQPERIVARADQQARVRAAAPRIPSPTDAERQAIEKHRGYLRGRTRLETASILRALVLLAVAALLFSIFRAGVHRVFVPGWWHR